jgi:hypothetical protein
VDVSLGIIVRNAADSITAFHPCHQHGTTKCQHVMTAGVAFTFSQHILKAYNESLAQGESSPHAVFTWEQIEVDANKGSQLDNDDSYICSFEQEIIDPWDRIACNESLGE